MTVALFIEHAQDCYVVQIHISYTKLLVFIHFRINDIVLRVNGKPMYNVTHHQAVKELKNSGSRVELVMTM